jgi:chromosome segregation ATPase
MFKSKKVKRLSEENEELKTRFQILYGKEENIKNLNEVLKRMRLEVSQLNEEKRTLQESIDQVRNQGEHKRHEIEELTKKIEHLREMKDELQNVVLNYSSQIENIEARIKEPGEKTGYAIPGQTETNEFENDNSELLGKQDEIEKFLNDAIARRNEINENESELIGHRENLSSEVAKLENKLGELLETFGEITVKIKSGNEKITTLRNEEERIKKAIEKKQNEISNVEAKLLRLKEEEGELQSKIGGLHSEESTKLNRVKEIESVLAEKIEIKNSLEEEHTILMNELNEQRKTLLNAKKEYELLNGETGARKKELFNTEQTLAIKAQKLTNLNMELKDCEKRHQAISSEINEIKNQRLEIHNDIQKEKEAANRFTEQNRKLTELVPLLEKRKEEIEQGNAELEERFTIMFQKFNQELNQINRKRSVLEQIVLRKEKDVDEKDQQLFEKIAGLEESERILNMRQIEIESLEKQIAGLREHKEVYRNELNKMEQETLERKTYSADIRLETELLLKKKVTLEQNLQDLLVYMNESFGKSKDRNVKFENEMNYYEEQIQAYRSDISDSLKELDEVRASIGNLKIEREEYKGQVTRLNTLKKKLQEEISKHQMILQRYQKLREKLKIEEAGGKSFDDIPPKGKVGQPRELKNPQVFRI